MSAHGWLYDYIFTLFYTRAEDLRLKALTHQAAVWHCHGCQ